MIANRNHGGVSSGMAKVNTCKTCKWWLAVLEKYPSIHLNTNKSAGGYCQSPKFVEGTYFSSAYAHDSLTYSYYEGGQFWTGPDFGCIHHTEESDNE